MIWSIYTDDFKMRVGVKDNKKLGNWPCHDGNAGTVVLFLPGRWSLCDRECMSLCMDVSTMSCVSVSTMSCIEDKNTMGCWSDFFPSSCFYQSHYSTLSMIIFLFYLSSSFSSFINLSFCLSPFSPTVLFFVVCLFHSLVYSISPFYFVFLSVSSSTFISCLGYEPKKLSEIILE